MVKGVIQRNVFGNNVINLVSDPSSFYRELTDGSKRKILDFLELNDLTSVVIRFEFTAESSELVQKINQFLLENNYKVYITSVMQSEIIRNQFTIERHPSDDTFAFIKIGSVV